MLANRGAADRQITRDTTADRDATYRGAAQCSQPNGHTTQREATHRNTAEPDEAASRATESNPADSRSSERHHSPRTSAGREPPLGLIPFRDDAVDLPDLLAGLFIRDVGIPRPVG